MRRITGFKVSSDGDEPTIGCSPPQHRPEGKTGKRADWRKGLLTAIVVAVKRPSHDRDAHSNAQRNGVQKRNKLRQAIQLGAKGVGTAGLVEKSSKR